MKGILILICLFSLSSFGKSFIVLNAESNREAFLTCKIILSDDYLQVIELASDAEICLSSNLFINKSISEKKYLFFEDEEILVEKKNEEIVKNKGTYFTAQSEFGIPQFIHKYPHFDGRGVKVGVIDDGISPHHEGFRETTDGKRKLIGSYSGSSYYEQKVEEIKQKDILESVIADFNFLKIFKMIEKTKKIKTKDEYLASYLIRAFILENNEEYLCIDKNKNKLFQLKSECVRDFNQTGDYIYLKKSQLNSFFGKVDLQKKVIKLSEIEVSVDSHGEGVASVMAGHKIGGMFDGVAPGSQILDYDIGEANDDENEKTSFYSISKFLKGLVILGENGAEVINISHSLYYTSLKSQQNMSRALQKIIKKYNLILTFSAGNNGPGIGSLNRKSIYPKNSLVVGAHVPQKLDEYVHGVTGLPPEGRVVYYSSRGPSASDGTGPSVISPLSSLSQSAESFRAFSGTSSAAPAMGGFAAILLSAIKGEHLKIDNTTVINAIKLSGRQLPGIPFVEQGYGLPQIEKAFDLYKLMIRGQLPMSIELYFGRQLSIINKSTSGIILYTSELNSVMEFNLKIRTLFSDFILQKERNEYFSIVNIIYSDKSLSGVSKKWIANRVSAFSFSMNRDKIDWKGETEKFLEIYIKDPVRNLTLAYFPITIIDDSLLSKKIKKTIVLGAEEGKRLHFKTMGTTKGIIAEIDLEGQQNTKFVISLYNSYGVKEIQYSSFKKTKNVFFFPTKRGERYQLGFGRSKGSEKKFMADLKITPVNLEIIQNIYFEDNYKGFKIKNKGPYVEGKFRFKEIDQKVKTFYNKGKVNEVFKFNYGIKKDETKVYVLKASVITKPDISYPYIPCKQKIKENILMGYCYPFDYFEKSKILFPYQVDITLLGAIYMEEINENIDRNEEATIFLKRTNPNVNRLEVIFSPTFSNNRSISISIGEIEFVE